jgi:hypothetical protein
MTRKTRIDTVSGLTSVVNASQNADLKPPKHIKMDKTDKIYFDAVIAEFAKSEWSQHLRELAAILARSMADLEREQRALRVEGSVIVGPTGKACINPRQSVVSSLTTTIMNMRRSLSLNARAQGGDARDIAKRREIAKQIEEDAGDFSDLI